MFEQQDLGGLVGILTNDLKGNKYRVDLQGPSKYLPLKGLFYNN
jgi:hypothetical protein